MNVAARAIVIGMLMIGFLPVLPLFSQPARATTYDWSGDQTLSGTQSFSGDTIMLAGNLTITGSVTFSNVELRVDSRANGTYSIEVLGGATFKVLSGSRIHSWNHDYRYAFHVRANSVFQMDRSTLEDCGWERAAQESRGLLLETNSASVTNSTLKNNCAGIVVGGGSSPQISQNDIVDNDQSGIYILESCAPQIDRNTISRNLRWLGGTGGVDAGIYSVSASPTITGNTISKNLDARYRSYSLGVALGTSGATANPVVKYNDITGHNDSSGWGMTVAGCNAVICKNNITYNHNGLEVGKGSSTVEGNLIDSNVVLGTPPTGTGLEDGGHSTYLCNTISRSPRGVFLADSSLSEFTECTLSQNVECALTGDATTTAFSTSFINCTIEGAGGDVLFNAPNGGTRGGMAFFVNTSFDPQKVYISDGAAKLKVSWYLRVNVIFDNGSRAADMAKVRIYDKTGAESPLLMTDAGGWTQQITLEEKTQTYWQNLSKSPYNVTGDKGGNSNWTSVALSQSMDVTLTLDDTWPWINVASPQDREVINRTSVNLTGTTSPFARVMIGAVAATMLPGGNWVASVNLPREGANNLSARANDGGKNEVWQNLTLIRDTVAPVIDLRSPPDNFLSNRTTVTVAGNISEAGGQTLVNGQEVALAAGGTFSVEVELVEGTNIIMVESHDAVWNTAFVLRTVIVDSIPPELVVTAPAADLVTTVPSLEIKGFTETNATVSLNGLSLRVDENNEFSSRVQLAEGENLYLLSARDRAGNNNTLLVRIVRDTTAPSLRITSPKEGAVFNTSTVEVRGIAEEGAVVKLNNITASLSGANFTAQVKLDKEGRNTILVEAWDALKNRAEMSLSLYRDTIPPDLKITSPQNNTLTREKSIELRGRTEKGATLTVGGRDVLVDNFGAFFTSQPLASEGPNVFTLRATDIAGNSALAFITILRDTQITYNVTQPVDGHKVKTQTVVVMGTAEPNSTVKVDNKPVTLRPDYTFIAEVTLTEGKNTIAVEFKDRAGNNATVVLTVYKETPAEPTKGFLPGFGLLPLLAAVPSALLLRVLGARKGGGRRGDN